jgi:hypothetical protein
MDNEIILKQDPELDLFSYHELLDRSYLIMTQIESFLIDHQVVEAHPELKKPLEDAMLLIGEVYRAAGTVEIEADDEE